MHECKAETAKHNHQGNKMKTSTSRIKLAVACALAFGAFSGTVQAQGFPGFSAPETRELWMEASRTQVWRSGYGLCWHSAFGPPPGYGECNPAPIAQIVAPAPRPVVAPAPVYVAPAPAPVITPAPLPPRQTRG